MLFALDRAGITAPSGQIDSALFNSAEHEDDVFGSYYTRESIKTIKFTDDFDTIPQGAWDISRKKDNSVLAWVTTSDGKMYDIFISCIKGECSVSTCNSMFDGYTQVTEIAFK